MINRTVIEHLKRWEGTRLVAYPDPGSRDGTPWTIGHGHTSDKKMRVSKGQVITKKQAEELLIHDAEEAANVIRSRVLVPLSSNQLGALISFVFNVGGGQFTSSTLLKRLNRGDYASVPFELRRWNKNDGRVMQGLVNRREAEAALWLSYDAPPVEKTSTGFWAWLASLFTKRN